LDNPKVRELFSKYRNLVSRFDQEILPNRYDLGNVARPEGHDSAGGEDSFSPRIGKISRSLENSLIRQGVLGIGL
jgi:hypothetical protein